jgi:EAL domain-containing protein (putative c-di-GMP-specific phosphodiesterase class I)
MDLERNAKSKKFLKHIISIGMDMGYGLIVEGVESDEQILLLRGFRTLLLQRYFFGTRPSE